MKTQDETGGGPGDVAGINFDLLKRMREESKYIEDYSMLDYIPRGFKKESSLFTYVCGPMDFATSGSISIDWRKIIIENSTMLPTVFYNPAAGILMPKLQIRKYKSSVANSICAFNREALKSCNAMFTLLELSTPTIGSIEEIRDFNGHMFVVSNIPQGRSIYLDDMIDRKQKQGHAGGKSVVRITIKQMSQEHIGAASVLFNLWVVSLTEEIK